MEALGQVKEPRYLPLAAVPTALAAHQLIEAVAWWSAGLRPRAGGHPCGPRISVTGDPFG